MMLFYFLDIQLLSIFSCLLTSISRFPWYKLEEDEERGTVVFRHDSETTYTPEELFGMILNHSRVIGEKFSGELHACTLKYGVPTESLLQLCCERAFLHDVVSAILMIKNKEMEAKLLHLN